MSKLIPFHFDGRDIRVIDVNGVPMFVGKDICGALGYVDHANAIKQHCKGVAFHHPLQTAGGVQELRVLAESDVLRLIISSALPAAQTFERWVFEEVLPSIRKTGSYLAPAVDPFAGLPPEQRALVVLMLDNATIKSQLVEQGAAVAKLDVRLDELTDTMQMTSRPTNSESIAHIRVRIGKLYGLPARIVDEVIRQSPYSPKPAGAVKNGHEDAQGSSYLVYWTKDVSMVFARFVGECERITATLVTHPLIEGRFKLVASPKGMV